MYAVRADCGGPDYETKAIDQLLNDSRTCDKLHISTFLFLGLFVLLNSKILMK